jgi:hypothetical protein
MYYNYLDFLPNDLYDKILNINITNIENQINILEEKISNLYLKLNLLSIKKYNKHSEITYDNVFYNMKEYLFSNINGDIILFNVYNDLFGDYYGYTYISKVLHNPTFLDILIEANKSLIKTKDYHHKYLDGLYNMDSNILYNYTGIVADNNIKYYEIMLGS